MRRFDLGLNRKTMMKELADERLLIICLTKSEEAADVLCRLILTSGK